MADAFSIKFDQSGLDAVLDGLAAGVQEQIRPAAQAGAQVFYDEVQLNVAAIGKKSGNLASSIYQVFSQDNSKDGRATYHISWNAKKAPHGHLVEYGHIQTRKVYLGKDGSSKSIYTSRVRFQVADCPAGRALEVRRWNAASYCKAEIMTVEADIFNALKGLVTNRVYPDVAPSGAAKPYITYQQVGGVPVNFLESAVVGKRNGRFQFNVWADTRLAAATLSRQVEDALVTSAALHGFVLSAPVADYQEDLLLYGTRQDISIWFT
jgi:hypothetical protein